MILTSYLLLGNVIVFLAIRPISGQRSWSYDEQDYWKLRFPSCGGDVQSPIDINTNYVHLNESLQLEFYHYSQHSAEYAMINDGQTIKFTHTDDSKHPEEHEGLSGSALNGGHYILGQFHFHWGRHNGRGSEHTIDGQAFEMELHLVHFDSDHFASLNEALHAKRGVVVLAVLFKAVKRNNDQLEALIRNVQTLRNQPVEQSASVKYSLRLVDLLPDIEAVSFFKYTGSLTTPPCTEGVTWFVLTRPTDIGYRQLKVFRSFFNFYHRNTFRDTQPLNGRKVQVSE